MAEENEPQDSESPPPPKKIVVYKRRRRRRRLDHHGGAWKVALADFMTAMFALFLVLWILTQSQEVKSAVASYFRHATDYEGKADEILRGNQGLLENKQGRLDLVNNMINYEGINGSKLDARSASGGLAKVAAEAALRPQVIDRVEEQEKDELKTFLNLADDLWSRLGMDPSFLKAKNNLSIEAREEGLVIQFIQQPNAPLFDEKTGALKVAFQELIHVIGRKIAQLPNKMEIDGHGSIFSNVPDSSQKWKSSMLMAELVRAQLQVSGIRDDQITKVSGCGVTRLLNPNNVNDPINQRISILVRPRQWRPERY